MEFFDIPTLQAAFTIRQGLDDAPHWSTVQQAIQEIAAVQLDTISVVARSHHLTLRNRVKGYEPEQLWKAIEDRQVFETWAHACCLVPIEEYPYYQHPYYRHRYAWEINQYNKYEHLLNKVEARIRNEGPLGSKDFADPSGKKRGGFWDWKPAKVALDILWGSGRLAIAARENFQRVYDLTERVIPSRYLDQQMEQDQVWRFFMERNLDCLVAARARDLCEYITCKNFALEMKRNRTKTMEKHLAILEEEDIVTRIEVLKTKQDYYVLTRQLPVLQKVQDRRHESSRVWFLSPFDNLLWNRLRVEELFGMAIKLEAYLPPAKRQFGYFVTPILWKHQLIGRIDPKADRANNSLILRNVEVDLSKNQLRDAIDSIREEVQRFKNFHELDQILIERAKPALLKKELVG